MAFVPKVFQSHQYLNWNLDNRRKRCITPLQRLRGLRRGDFGTLAIYRVSVTLLRTDDGYHRESPGTGQVLLELARLTGTD